MPQPEENEATESVWLNGPYGKYIAGLAEIAYAVCERYDLHDDAARQACFATIVIDAKDHMLFISDAVKDKKGAEKTDAHIKEIDPNPTPDKFDDVTRETLLKGINDARESLNKEGYIPTLTPAALNLHIKNDLNLEGNLGSLDTDDLQKVIKWIAEKLTAHRAAKSTATEAGF